MAIKDALRTFILNNYLFTDDASALADNQSFLDSGIIDSMGVMEIVLFVEQEFGIAIEDADITPENLDNLNSICALIQRKNPELIS
jgi:acyl carrier protein